MPPARWAKTPASSRMDAASPVQDAPTPRRPGSLQDPPRVLPPLVHPIPEPRTVEHVNGSHRPRPAPGGSAARGTRRTTLAAIGILAAAWFAFVGPMFAGKVYFPTPFGTPFFQVPA